MPDDFPGDRGVFALRRFLASVAASVGAAPTSNGGDPADWVLTPATPPDAWPAWEEFVPTAIYLAQPLDEDRPTIRPDVDGSNPARFMTGLKIMDCERQYPGVRVQRVSVRAYLAPPARLTEIAARAGYLTASGHPMGLDARRIDLGGGIYRALSRNERRQLDFILPDERIAMAAVLAAVGRPVVAFSEDGSWPRHPLLAKAAQRVGSTIVRRSLGEIPPHVRRHIRIVRYRTISEESREEEGSEA